MEFTNNNKTEEVEMKLEDVSEWEANCYLYARCVWALDVRNIRESDIKGLMGEVVDHVGLQGIYRINEILNDYYDIWEEQLDK